mgnify:CR=1 FL=1|jgi:hypothetical protein
MISYYKYYQAICKCEESLKTVIAMQPDVPPMVEAQYEMDTMIMQYWKEKSEKFTKYFLIFLMVSVIMVTAYVRGYINV